MLNETQLAGCSDAELAATDPLEMNLAAARGVPSLAELDVSYYKGLADGWAAELKRQLPAFEERFWRMPQEWDNDIHMYRLGVLCHFVHNDLGVRYREDQKFAHKIAYTDPGDLFLNGVMDTRRGTCGNMAALHVALGWRLGWPVSLALAPGTASFASTTGGRSGTSRRPTRRAASAPTRTATTKRSTTSRRGTSTAGRT